MCMLINVQIFGLYIHKPLSMGKRKNRETLKQIKRSILTRKWHQKRKKRWKIKQKGKNEV